jgi:hypothetical protein
MAMMVTSETLHCFHPLSRRSYVVPVCCCCIILSYFLYYSITQYLNYCRLYGCLRLACGWILWHIRQVDDGRFRRHVCEALSVCYLLQALAVTRAQFTDRHVMINYVAIMLLLALAIAYGSFRFGKGGNLIKIYELPTASALQ